MRMVLVSKTVADVEEELNILRAVTVLSYILQTAHFRVRAYESTTGYISRCGKSMWNRVAVMRMN